jgi:serine/threonine protein kinase
VTRKIGGGGFGEIYEGIDLVTKEQVALKLGRVAICFTLLLNIVLVGFISKLSILKLDPVQGPILSLTVKMAKLFNFVLYVV